MASTASNERKVPLDCVVAPWCAGTAMSAALINQRLVIIVDAHENAMMQARMTKAAKLARALVLRDAALKVLGRVGAWEAVGVNRKTLDAGEVKVLAAHLSGLHISYRTPFQHMPQADDLLKYRGAQLGRTAPQNLPYGLDVWAPKKVLNMEWDDRGNVTLVSLRPGAWETELITLAQTEVLD